MGVHQEKLKASLTGHLKEIQRKTMKKAIVTTSQTKQWSELKDLNDSVCLLLDGKTERRYNKSCKKEKRNFFFLCSGERKSDRLA